MTVYRYRVWYISGAGTRIHCVGKREVLKHKRRGTQFAEQYSIMCDTEPGGNNESVEPISEEEKALERKIETEINKLKFYLEGAEELIKEKDFSEIKITCKRTDGIQERLNDHVSEEQFRREIHQQEKDPWEEKMNAELKMAEKKIEMEQAAKSARSKLPES